MIRKGGRLQNATWDEAIQLFTQKIGESRARGDSVNAAFINGHETGTFRAFLDGWLSFNGMPPALSYDPDADYTAMARRARAERRQEPREPVLRVADDAERVHRARLMLRGYLSDLVGVKP